MSGDHHVHDVKQFGFAAQSTKLKEVHGGVYYYNQRRNFHENGIIYKTNREVYETAENVDTLISGIAGYCMYKVGKNMYCLSMGLPWYPAWTAGWALLSYV